MSVKGKSVLIIDDDPDIVSLVYKLLENVGMFVLSASSLSEGLELLKKSPPNLILLDLSFPNENGLFFLKNLANFPVLQSIPVIIVSAISEIESVRNAMALGAVNYIIKPFRTNILLQKIRKTLMESHGAKNLVLLDKAQPAEATIVASALGINDSEILIGSSVRFEKDSVFEVNGVIWDHFVCRNNRKVVRGVKTAKIRSSNGQYLCKAGVVGISETEQAQIMKKIIRWKKLTN
ncbi:MAG: response regulator [Oligoflexia bacterium]|nr:response regulator [Oligoflexia bacterium]